MKRRAFVKLAAATPLAVELITASTQAVGATPLKPAASAPLPPGLPPTTRDVLLACRNCGRELGYMQLDEFDRAEQLACGRCYENLEDERAAAQDGTDKDDYDLLVEERDELRSDLDRSDDDRAKVSSAIKSLVDKFSELRWTLHDAGVHERHLDVLEDLTWRLGKV